MGPKTTEATCAGRRPSRSCGGSSPRLLSAPNRVASRVRRVPAEAAELRCEVVAVVSFVVAVVPVVPIVAVVAVAVVVVGSGGVRHLKLLWEVLLFGCRHRPGAGSFASLRSLFHH